MFSVLKGISWGLCLIALFFQPIVFAELRLPDVSNRQPNLSLDPFEKLRKNAAEKREQSSVKPTIEQPVAQEKPIQAEHTEDSRLKILKQPPRLLKQAVEHKNTAPAFNYTLFLDLDYINKFSGGASSIPMSDDPMVPSPTAIVGLLHFWGKYDTAKAGLWKNGAFVVHMIYGEGTSPTQTVGDLRSVSNIDGSFMRESDGKRVMPGLDLLELWYEHKFPLNKSSIRVGIGYLSSDFYKSNYTDTFLSSGIGSIGTEVLWNSMASNPPNTTLGIWYKTKLTENLYGQAVAFDGLPDHSTDFVNIKFEADEGMFLASEVGWLAGSPKSAEYFKLGLGYWYLSQNIDHVGMVGVEGFPEEVAATSGFYTVIDKALDEKTGVFFKGGVAIGDINEYSRYFTTGITRKGIIKSRPKDVIGVAVVQSKLSDSFMEINGTDAQGNLTSYTTETIYELTYSIHLFKWLTIQPDLQYVLQPNMNINNKNALVGLVRAKITLL